MVSLGDCFNVDFGYRDNLNQIDNRNRRILKKERGQNEDIV